MYSDSHDILSDGDIVTEHKLMSPAVIICRSRLALVAHIMSKQPLILLQMINVCLHIKQGWISAVEQDLAWLSLSGEFESKGISLDLQYICDNSKRFRSILKKFSYFRFANLDMAIAGSVYNPPYKVDSVCSVCGYEGAFFKLLGCTSLGSMA